MVTVGAAIDPISVVGGLTVVRAVFDALIVGGLAVVRAVFDALIVGSLAVVRAVLDADIRRRLRGGLCDGRDPDRETRCKDDRGDARSGGEPDLLLLFGFHVSLPF